MQTTIRKINFLNSGYYFIGLIVLVLAGFGPSYFIKFFNGTGNFNFYFHFHAAMVSLWIIALIVQPILIKKKKLPMHRLIGKMSYLVMPLLFISVILLAHFRIQDHITVINNENFYGPHLMVPFKDLLIIAVLYPIAIYRRKNIHVHARAMVATGIVFIEPALARLLMYLLKPNGLLAFILTIATVYAILITLMIMERKQHQGRWVFPLVLGLYIVVHSLIMFGVQIGPWETFSRWFAALPITQ